MFGVKPRNFGWLQTPAHACTTLADFSTLKMEAIRSSETSVQTKSTWRHILEDDHSSTVYLFNQSVLSFDLCFYKVLPLESQDLASCPWMFVNYNFLLCCYSRLQTRSLFGTILMVLSSVWRVMISLCKHWEAEMPVWLLLNMLLKGSYSAVLCIQLVSATPDGCDLVRSSIRITLWGALYNVCCSRWKFCLSRISADILWRLSQDILLIRDSKIFTYVS
jgi:hypothetical protein